MDSDKTKMILAILGCCGALTLGVWAWQSGSRTAGVDSVPEGETVWVQCVNKSCGVSYEMALKEYYMKVDEKVAYSSIPPIDCETCGKQSVFRGNKCASCGKVFMSKSDGDHCSKCAAK